MILEEVVVSFGCVKIYENFAFSRRPPAKCFSEVVTHEFSSSSSIHNARYSHRYSDISDRQYWLPHSFDWTTINLVSNEQVLVSGRTFFRTITTFLGSTLRGMESFDIIQLVRYGRVDEILNILDRTVSTREIFLQQVGPNINQFIGLAACTGSIEILQHCKIKYCVEIKIGSELGLHATVGAASRGHDHVIEWLLKPWLEERRLMEQTPDFNEMRLPQNWLYLPLHKAVLGQHVSTVKLLVEKAKADVNAGDEKKLRPLEVAADPVDKDNLDQMSRYEEIIDILVTIEAQSTDSQECSVFINFPNQQKTTPLHDAVKLNSHKAIKKLIDGGADVSIPCTEDKRTVLHLVAEDGLDETLRVLVDHDRVRKKDPCYFDVEDENGATPLYIAASGGHQECVRILINKGLSLTSKNEKRNYKTAMDIIFERIPNPVTFLTKLLDERVTATNNSDNNITIDFSLLVSKHSPDCKHKFSDMDVVIALINAIQKMEQMAILQHPLLETFIRLQYLTALPCGVFVFLSQLLITGCTSWYFTRWDEITDLESGGLAVPLLLLFGSILSIENGLRFVLLYRMVKLDKLNMFVLFTSYAISTINCIYSIPVIAIALRGFRDNILPVDVTLESIIFVLLWIHLMLLSVQFPIIGEYHFMFLAVLMNIGKVLLSFIWLITAFVLVFPVLFPDNNQFDSPWKAIGKTLAMMTGEYEYGSIFTSTDQSNCTSNDSTSAENNNCPQQAVSIFVFLVFVIVCSITLMNLMVGLAVGDIQELRKKGHIRRLMTQVIWVTGMNRIPYCCNRKIRTKLELNLNSRSWTTYFRIPTHVRKPLYDLALENSNNRKERPQMESPRDNTQEILTSIQTSYAAIQSSLRRVVVEQQLQDCQIKRLTQDREPKWRRRSL